LTFSLKTWEKLWVLKKKSHAPSWEAWLLQAVGIEKADKEEESIQSSEKESIQGGKVEE